MSKIYHDPKLLVVFIFSFSVVCSVVFLFFFKNVGPVEHQIPGSDYFSRYEPIANSLLAGKGFRADGKLMNESGPGFPVMLAGIFTLSEAIKIDRFNLILIFNVLLTAL
ncbi:MAG: hypothetical protein HYT19_01805, partial [Candidatus Nealsonbacteria bacterium]|nr:hypothetical protein [Candidatus Nealsonbacteria bacterium]